MPDCHLATEKAIELWQEHCCLQCGSLKHENPTDECEGHSCMICFGPHNTIICYQAIKRISTTDDEISPSNFDQIKMSENKENFSPDNRYMPMDFKHNQHVENNLSKYMS